MILQLDSLFIFYMTSIIAFISFILLNYIKQNVN